MNCKCGNAARYMNERGELCCGICPLKERIDSIKLADVPKLLAWARGLVDSCQEGGVERPVLTYRLLGELIDIVQRKPKPTLVVEMSTEQRVARLTAEIEYLESEIGLRIALREVLHTGKGYPPANVAADEEGPVRCCCHHAGWLGPHHDDPNCEYRT
jgi:hypothetical protein